MNEQKITRENHEKTTDGRCRKKNHNGDNIINSEILAKSRAKETISDDDTYLFIHSYCNLLNGCEFTCGSRRSEQYIYMPVA